MFSRPFSLDKVEGPLLLVLVALICLVPFNYMPGYALKVPGGSVPLHFAIFVPVGLFILATGAWDSWKRRRIPALVTLSLALLATMLASSVEAVSKREALSTCAGFLFRNVAIGWLAYRVGRDGGEDFVRRWLPWIGALVALTALYEPLTGRYFIRRALPADVDFNELWAPARGIAVGAIGQPLPLAALLNLFLPFALWEWSRRRRWFWAVPSLAIFGGILMTFRRSGYAVALAAVLLFVLQSDNRRRRLLALSGAAALFFGCVLAVPASRELFMDRFNLGRTVNEIRMSHRTRVYGTVMGMVKSEPILGIGTRQYERRYREFATYPAPLPTPDNQFLRFLAEGGLLGFAAFLSFLGYVLARLWKGRVGADPFLMATAGFAVTLLLLDGIYWPAPAIVFFAVAGAGIGRTEGMNF